MKKWNFRYFLPATSIFIFLLSFAPIEVLGAQPRQSASEKKEFAGTISPYSVHYTQDTISPYFSDGTSVYSLIEQLRTRKISPRDIPAIRVFLWKGNIYSVDNRRLFAFRQAKLDVPYILLTDMKEVLSQMSYKFTTKNEGMDIIVRSSAD